MAVAIGPTTPGMALPGMDEELFARWAQLLEQRTGVVVAPARMTFLVGAVRSRMRETGFGDYEAYFRLVSTGAAGAVEWATLVDRLTVHETRFFRHAPSLDLIARRWLPERIAAGRERLHAWSVGCASGEEAWSLAMVIDHALAALGHGPTYGITASDVSHAALAAARSAQYPAARLAEIPLEYRSVYVEMNDNDVFAPIERLRRRVGFARVNLLHAAAAPLKRLDLIYCQNVLIYFARERRRELLDGLAGLLEPGGLLVLGAGEVTSFSHPALTRVAAPGTLAYLRNR